MLESAIRNVEILRIYTSGSRDRTMDEVLEERPLTLEVDGKEEALVILSPGNEKHWALGHLACRGMITSLDDVDRITITKDRVCVFRNVERIGITLTNTMIHTGSTRLVEGISIIKAFPCPLNVKWSVSPSILIKAVEKLAESSLFIRTGSVHVALLASIEGEILFRVEDIGRHNAVDKSIGWALVHGIEMGKCFMAVSGRLPADMVYKAIGAGIPMLASVSAVTASGIDAAVKGGITLIGFARNGRFNVYSFPERIKVSKKVKGAGGL